MKMNICSRGWRRKRGRKTHDRLIIRATTMGLMHEKPNKHSAHEREIARIVIEHRKQYPHGLSEWEIMQEMERRMKTRPFSFKRIAATAAMLVLCVVGAAQAQIATCGGPEPVGVVGNPTTMVFKNVYHVLAVSYTIGVVDSGVDPTKPGATVMAQTTVPLGSVTAVASETDCYQAPIPLAVQASLMLLKPFRATVKYTSSDGADTGWSAVSNPFVKAGPATAVIGVRIIRQ